MSLHYTVPTYSRMGQLRSWLFLMGSTPRLLTHLARPCGWQRDSTVIPEVWAVLWL